MSAETRLYPGDREPRAIKIRKPKHTARNVIIIIVAALIVVGAGGAFAWMYFRNEPPLLSVADGESSSESSSEEISRNKSRKARRFPSRNQNRNRSP